MAVEYPNDYWIEGGRDGAIQLRKVIQATTMQRLVANAMWLYCQNNRRVLAQWASTYGAAPPASWTTLLEVPATIGQDRDSTDLHLTVTGTDVQCRFTVYNAAKTVVIGTAVTVTVTGTGSATSSITMSSPATDVVVMVEWQQRSGGTGYDLTGVRVLEGICDSGDVSTAYPKIDADALGADESLAALFGRRLASGLLESAEERAVGVVSAWSVDDPALVHGYVEGANDETRCVIPFLAPARVFDRTLTVRARGSVHGHDVTIGVCSRPVGPGIVPPNAGEVTSTAGAGAVTEDVGDVDLTPYVADGMALVFLTFRSDYDSTGQVLTDASGLTNAVSWNRWGVQLTTGGQWNAGGGAFANSKLPYWIESISGTTSGAQALDDLPAPRFVRRHVLDYRDGGAADDRIYVHPPFESDDAIDAIESGSAASGYWVRRHALGYLDLYGIDWTVSAIQTLSDGGQAFEPGRRTSVMTAHRLQTFADELLGRYTRVHAMGPAPRLDTADADASFTGPVDTIAPFVAGSAGTFVDLAKCLVANEDTMTFDGETSYERALYIVDALVMVWCYDPDVDGRTDDDAFAMDQDFRIMLDAPEDGGGAVMEGTIGNGGRVNEVRFRPHVMRPYGGQKDVAGYWAGFYPAQDANFSLNTPEPAQSAGRGLWPEHLWQSLRWQRVRLQLLDNTGGEARSLTLQVKTPSLTATGASSARFHPYVQLLTWTVQTAPFVPSLDAIADYGVEISGASLEALIADADHLWYLADGTDEIDSAPLSTGTGGSFGSATLSWSSGLGSVTDVGISRGLYTGTTVRTDGEVMRTYETVIQLESGFGAGVLIEFGAVIAGKCAWQIRNFSGKFQLIKNGSGSWLDSGVTCAVGYWYIGVSAGPDGWVLAVAEMGSGTATVVTSATDILSVGPWTSRLGIGYNQSTNSVVHKAHIALVSTGIELTESRALQWASLGV